ncbi:hypothetical protein MUN78_04540 [Leucobacter allii]|uniref:Uncharacterized protein n=1 Tax=Leucobacter allii TaxID=2932247 RepID=A0ABY4FPB5_9MICO|nr:hypothetical protein [Leucobacter allii]UOQ58120.1 hypothetical protein MUN78_04540 [Leucobacter allii]
MSSAPDPLTHAQRAAFATTEGDRVRALQPVSPLGPTDERPLIQDARDCYRLLAWAAALDGRDRGEYEAAAWWEALAPFGFAFEDARIAITRHYTRSRYPVMPADIIQIIEDGDLP